MAIKDIFKVSRKTFFDPSAWLGANLLSAYTETLGKSLKQTFTVDKPQRIETFEQALQRLKITDADLQHTASRYRIYALLFLGLGVVSFLAGFYYLFEYRTVTGWILAMMVTLLFGANAFRFDFWYFQIKHRKLGCTVREWWHDQLGVPKGPTS